MTKQALAALVLVSGVLFSGCSGGDPAPVVGNSPGVSEVSKGEESPEVQARAKEKEATRPGSNSQFGRD